MRIRRTENFKISDFYCTRCGKKGISLPRKDNQKREPGHLKNLYCPYCKSQQNAVEIRGYGKYTYEDFEMEYKNKNFDEKGKRILPFPQFKANIYNQKGE